MKEYDRMSPEIGELYELLKDYSAITYGRPAYPLSGKEAELLVNFINSCLNVIHKNALEWQATSPHEYKQLVAWQRCQDILNEINGSKGA